MKQELLTQLLKNRAADLGFTLVGVCPAVAPPGLSHLHEWLERGYAGDMQYLADRRDAYAHPQHVLDGARSVVMLALPYRTVEPAPASSGQGRVARYAWGEFDYHETIRSRLHDLADYLRELVPEAAARGVVDTAPLLEREFALLAGLGWIGKNTLLLNRDAGSYFFLAALLTDQQLDYDAAHAADHCGTCTACLDACPTQAFPQPYVLDATRCISYLTIEHKGAIPADLRAGIGDWLFGCDVCQEVCPWNHHAAKQSETSEASRVVPDHGKREQDKVPGTSSTPAEKIPVPRREGLGEGFPTTPSNNTTAFSENEQGKVPVTLSETIPHSAFRIPHSPSFHPLPNTNPIDLAALFDLTEADFRMRFRHTPLWRPHRRGLLRNAAIVLGNQRDAAAIPALTKGLDDEEPLVREACDWALAEIRAHPAG